MRSGRVVGEMPKVKRKPIDTERRTPHDDKETMSLTDRATQTVRDRILDLTLAPGMILDERQILEKFEFGRTPMREALNRLISEGLVVARGQRGLQVAPLNIASAVELFDAYVMSERMVAFALCFSDAGLVDDLRQLHAAYAESLAPTDLLRVTELNVLFHRRLASATRNIYIEEYSGKLHKLARRLSYFIYKREAAMDTLAPTLFDKPRADHERIIETIEKHDRQGLIDELTSHAIFFRTRLARIISEDRSLNLEFAGLATKF